MRGFYYLLTHRGHSSSYHKKIKFFLQPVIWLTYFQALLMYEYHDILNGNVISCVDSTIIAEGEDDYFDYDDHTAYQYDSNLYYKDLLLSQGSGLDEFKMPYVTNF